jgi:hypothetical protein
MSRVIAALDNGLGARVVLETALAVAPLFRASVDAVHCREDGDELARWTAVDAGLELHELDGLVEQRLVEEGERTSVAALVVGAHRVPIGARPVGTVAMALITTLAKPIVVAPPEAEISSTLTRVLVPLDGTAETSAALLRTLTLACAADIDVVCLHVLQEHTVPAFSDQPQHEVTVWIDEFLARYAPCPGIRLELRIGVPGAHVVHVAEEIQASLIALGWSQDMSPGRAAVVREALERSSVPVLLVPVARGEPR